MDRNTKILVGLAVVAGVGALIASTLTPTSPLYYQSIASELHRVVY